MSWSHPPSRSNAEAVTESDTEILGRRRPATWGRSRTSRSLLATGPRPSVLSPAGQPVSEPPVRISAASNAATRNRPVRSRDLQSAARTVPPRQRSPQAKGNVGHRPRQLLGVKKVPNRRSGHSGHSGRRQGCAKWVRDPRFSLDTTSSTRKAAWWDTSALVRRKGVQWPEGLGVSRRVFGSENRTEIRLEKRCLGEVHDALRGDLPSKRIAHRSALNRGGVSSSGSRQAKRGALTPPRWLGWSDEHHPLRTGVDEAHRSDGRVPALHSQSPATPSMGMSYVATVFSP